MSMVMVIFLIPLLVLTGIAVIMLVVTERSKFEGQKLPDEEAAQCVFRGSFTLRTNMQGSGRVWIYGANVLVFDTYLRLMGRRPLGAPFDIYIHSRNILKIRSTGGPWRSLIIDVNSGGDPKYVQVLSGRISDLARVLKSRFPVE